MRERILAILEVDKLNVDGQHTLAMSMLYSDIYDILMEQDFAKCDLYMDHFMSQPFSTMLRVAFARITKPHKTKLKLRHELIHALKNRLFQECPTKEEAESVLSHIK